jgi:hypothetical protein
MMMVLLIAGIGAVVAGVLAIFFGIPVKEFSFGNTLILSGAVAVCTGLVILALAVVVRELKVIGRRLGPLGPAAQSAAGRERTEPPSATFVRAETGEEPTVDRPLFLRDQAAPAVVVAPEPATPPAVPRPDDSVRPRQRGGAAVADEPEPEEKPRRNLMFSSASRRERERAAARAGEPVADLSAAVAPPPMTARPVEAAARPALEDAWPEPARSDPYRRGSRASSAFNDANAVERAHGAADPSQVTVLKSGVVDGMAYSLYSDGSIEAQMPEGMMRFASIGELRAHLDQRP